MVIRKLSYFIFLLQIIMDLVKLSKLLLSLAWMIFIFISSHIAVPPEDPERQKALIEYAYDKSMHLLLFGILAYLIVSFLLEYKRLKFYWIVLITIIFCYFYGITDEWHQGFIGGRGVSYWDLVFDVVGAIGGVLAYYVFHKKDPPN